MHIAEVSYLAFHANGTDVIFLHFMQFVQVSYFVHICVNCTNVIFLRKSHRFHIARPLSLHYNSCIIITKIFHPAKMLITFESHGILCVFSHK